MFTPHQTSIKFVRTSHHYDSYVDFFKLAELSGFEIVHLNQVDVSEDIVYILAPHTGGTNANEGEWNPHITKQAHKPRMAHLILWCLERPSGTETKTVGTYAANNRALLTARLFDEVWVGDPRLADDAHLRFVPLGSHANLGVVNSFGRRFNFASMSYDVPRRTALKAKFIQLFPNAGFAPNAWEPQRGSVLNATRFGLNIHQDNFPYIEPLRIALFAGYGLPIISEAVADTRPFDDLIFWASYDDLPYLMKEMLLNDYEIYRQHALRANNIICNEFNFGKLVRQAVHESVGGDWR